MTLNQVEENQLEAEASEGVVAAWTAALQEATPASNAAKKATSREIVQTRATMLEEHAVQAALANATSATRRATWQETVLTKRAAETEVVVGEAEAAAVAAAEVAPASSATKTVTSLASVPTTRAATRDSAETTAAP